VELTWLLEHVELVFIFDTKLHECSAAGQVFRATIHEYLSIGARPADSSSNGTLELTDEQVVLNAHTNRLPGHEADVQVKDGIADAQPLGMWLHHAVNLGEFWNVGAAHHDRQKPSGLPSVRVWAMRNRTLFPSCPAE
jgi:hypothetical protein